MSHFDAADSKRYMPVSICIGITHPANRSRGVEKYIKLCLVVVYVNLSVLVRDLQLFCFRCEYSGHKYGGNCDTR